MLATPNCSRTLKVFASSNRCLPIHMWSHIQGSPPHIKGYPKFSINSIAFRVLSIVIVLSIPFYKILKVLKELKVPRNWPIIFLRKNKLDSKKSYPRKLHLSPSHCLSSIFFIRNSSLFNVAHLQMLNQLSEALLFFYSTPGLRTEDAN